MEPAITFRDVSKRYVLHHAVGLKNILFHLPTYLTGKKNSIVHSLSNISFEVAKGETVGFIGPNGAGKSTILSLTAKVLYPDQGEIVVQGRVSPLLELGAGFHYELNGKENIYLNAILLGMTRREINKKIDSIIEFSELAYFIDQPVRTYSSGMLARLGFSVAVHIEPEIVLIDEILAVGDAHFQKKSFEKVLEFKKKGVTIILVSHDLDSVEKVCDKVIWLESGKIIAMGSDVSKIIDQYGKKYTS